MTIPPLVKLIVGFLFPNTQLYQWTIRELSSLWGGIERKSPIYPFDHTDYYRDIAPVLYKAFVSFKGLYPADQLVRWKLQAVALEAESGPKRSVNIDPGYLDGARLILPQLKITPTGYTSRMAYLPKLPYDLCLANGFPMIILFPILRAVATMIFEPG